MAAWSPQLQWDLHRSPRRGLRRTTRDALIGRETLPGGAALGAIASASALPQEGMVSAGFDSPGNDMTVRCIDLNEALSHPPQSTFAMRATGDAMTAAGIANGDLLLVNRALKAEHGHAVVAAVDGELICRRLQMRPGRAKLEAAAAAHGDVVLAILPVLSWMCASNNSPIQTSSGFPRRRPTAIPSAMSDRPSSW